MTLLWIALLAMVWVCSAYLLTKHNVPCNLNNIILVILIIIGLYMAGMCAEILISSTNHTCPTPTITHVQTLLLEQGYDLGPTGADGKLGTKTITAYTLWSKINDPYMIKIMEDAGMK